ncbi:MAG: hypothetical protein IKO99_04565 [Bacteroidales bacterium]|nr:hypothetical protein [Bacteroidales bacterium]
MEKKILVCLISLLVCCYVNAQNQKVTVALRFMDNNPDLARSVGNTLSSMFSEFYSAWGANTQPNLSGLYIREDTKNKILGLWNRHKFRLAGLSCSLGVAKVYGENEFAVFSIPMQVEGCANVAEYTIQFNTRGVITNFERSNFPILSFQTGKRVADEQTKGTIKVILYQLSKAYHDKDINYLRKIYDPDGYCITGKRATTTTSNYPGQELRIQLEHTYYDLTIKKLHQYLDDLEKVFAANSWIKTTFGTPEITAHQNPNPTYDGIYYINLLQNYKSQNYSDEGWLTIVLDLRDKSNPQIMARIWLPDKITNEQLTNLF